MKRSDLEHILRAAKGATGATELIGIGSQSILARFPDAPRERRKSMEADLYPRFKPELASMIEGTLGRYSQFDQTFGYYADGVGPETATLPPGWDQRLIAITNENTGGAVGWCLEPHDLAIGKLAARREKDLTFVSALLRFKMVRPSRLEELIKTLTDATLREALGEALTISRRQAASSPKTP